ncbi:MAG: DPP IV N-terminal domain-containing protein, partial [Gemmataceae bacterium]|nr:DPP IV N-terminal domain-containing protein [Gemmataceae bacterium]
MPNLNPDGNDKIDPKNRPRENGPVNGAGTRENAQGLDLNRDFVKLESPEVRALVKLVRDWNPLVVIDCHTTNGSKHRFTLTYDGPRYPSSDTDLAKWADNTLFPAVTKRVKAATNFDIAPYGNFNRDRTKWETYPATPRYGIQYLALCGRLGVLSESYSYASFKDRVAATKAFVTACFAVAAEKKADLVKLARPESAKRVALRTETSAFAKKLDVLGFAEIEKEGKRVATDEHKVYQLDFVGKVGPTAFAELPFAYLVPAKNEAAIQTLQRHGIRVEELREDVVLDVETFAVSKVGSREYAPKKWVHTDVEGEWRKEGTRVPAGTALVKSAQPLGALAAYLLEPQSEDGLATWDVFQPSIAAGRGFPVQRLAKAVPLTLGAAAPLPEAQRPQPPGFGSVNIQGWLDAEHFLQVKDGKLLKVEARTGKGEPWTDPEKIKKSLAAIKDLKPETADQIAKGTFFRMVLDRTAFQFDVGSDPAVGFFDGTPAYRFPKTGGQQFATLSPSARYLAFVRGNNLFVAEAEKDQEKQLTTDGGEDIFNGRGDWVYEEEIFNRRGQAYWWSPDSKQIAFVRFDDKPVKKFNLVDLAPVQGRLESYAYPKPGDPNPLVKIGVADVASGKVSFLDAGAYKPEDTVVARVGWVPGTKAVFAYVQNRTQTWLDFVVWESPDAKPKALFRETTKAWVEDTGPPQFLPDGSFLFL